MKNQFISYNLALKLKELGFDEECLGYFDNKKELIINDAVCDPWINTNKNISDYYSKYITAPLWQQAFDWFREKYSILTFVDSLSPIKGKSYLYNIEYLQKEYNDKSKYYKSIGLFETYQEAREACLEKLIELCKNK